MPPFFYVLLWTQMLATLPLLGLIWTIQLVHYPLFARIGTAEFVEYQTQHMRRITWVVAPLMLVELATAILLVVLAPLDVLAIIGLALVILIWTSTACIQVPSHHRLASGFDPKAHAWLMKSNWIRTIAWTARTAICVAMLAAD